MSSTLRINHDGVGLHVEVDGPAGAVPVVFLHGVTSSGKTWEWLPEEVTQRHRIVRIDFRGHGRSDHKPGYTVADYAGDVLAVLEEVGTPAVLVGHSLGGVVAWWVAQKHPDQATAAFLEDPPLFASELSEERAGRVREIFHLLLANVLSYRAEGLSVEAISKRIGDSAFGPRGVLPFREIAMDDGVNAMAFGLSRLDVRVIEGAIDGSTLASTDVRSPVKRPVTILAADDAFGAAFSVSDQKRLAQTHPSVKVIRVMGCGHGIHDDRRHRETFVQHLCRFLDTHAPRAQQKSV
jgi:pimeloyl-ACP methyl ester carboxylesterase